MFCEGVAPKTKVRNSGKVVLRGAFKLLQIEKLKKLGQLNTSEEFINSKKNVMMNVKRPNCYMFYTIT